MSRTGLVKPVIKVRDLTDSRLLPISRSLAFRVNSLRHSVWGGPKELTMTAFGDAASLFELATALRCPVEVYDQASRLVWWGYVNTVTIKVDAMKLGLSLSTMYNRVRVEYNEVRSGARVLGSPQMTAWVEDADSVAEYGTREIQETLHDATQLQAETLRDLLLDRQKLPVAKWDTSGHSGSYSAAVQCVGWFNSLNWTRYSLDEGYEMYDDPGEGIQDVGNADVTNSAAQLFQVTGSKTYKAHSVEIRYRKEGNPTDNIKVSLWSLSGGAPLAQIAQGTAAGTSSPTDYTRVTFIMDVNPDMVPGTDHWIVISRTGADDGTNYYKVDLNEDAGYALGEAKQYKLSTTTWSTRSPAADFLFNLTGVRETSEQIEDIVTSNGEFINTFFRDVDSGVYTSPYRESELPAGEEIIALCKLGSDNSRRLIPYVDVNRNFFLTEEPVEPEALDIPSWFLTSTGRLKTSNHASIDPHVIPVGVWARMKHETPVNKNSLLVNQVDTVFIEEFSYNFATRRVSIYPRDISSPWDIGVQA